PIVLIASLVALPFVWIVMPRMLGDNRIETVHAQRLFETRLRVTEDSILNGRQLSELQSRLPAGIEFHDVPVGLLRPQHRLRMTGT
ncbi:MAG TPA: SLC13 family permease, partial [Erythrobacter sp.]|nr:SLC13 family permease [Erythrobacter sp.]